MADAVQSQWEPDVSQLIIEDGAPLDGTFQEREMRLLVSSLYASWTPSRDFVALANVGVFSGGETPVVVPDVLVTLGVRMLGPIEEKRNQSYFVWRYGKPPDIAVEIVSNRVGGEEDKLLTYAQLGVAYVVIHDPTGLLSDRVLRVYQLHGRSYVDHLPWLPDVGLGLCLWPGEFEGGQATWLRWTDSDGRVLPTGPEKAEQERQRAEAAELRVKELEQRLRELGAEPG